MDALPLREIVVFLVAAGIIIPVARHLRISQVLAFLLTGLVLGPHASEPLADHVPWLQYVLITDSEGVRALAELGVVFLLFMIGLELSLARMWRTRRQVLGLGGAQILISSLVIAGIALQFDNTLPAALVLGGSLALSSTAIVLQLIREQGRFTTHVGQAAFSVLLAQDIAVVPLLFVIGALGGNSGASLPAALSLALLQATITVAVILGAERLLIAPFMRFVAGARSPEAFMAATLLVVIATAAGTHAAGMSGALGAFLAGLVFAETEYRHEIEVIVEPFKGLLLGLFFMSVGMSIDLATIAADPVWIAASVAGLLAVKAVIGGALARAFGLTRGQSAELGLLLSQGGEFAFVALAAAMTLALVPRDTGQFMLVVVGTTMFLTPTLARLGQLAAQRLDRGEDDAHEPDVADDLREHVIIVGYGRSGRLLGELLDEQQIGWIALDRDATRVSRLRREGVPVYAGDASRPALLEKLRLADASALVLSTDDGTASERVLGAAHRLAPSVPILVRARDLVHARELHDLGASAVVSELLESSLQLGQLTLQAAGLPPGAAREAVDARRELEAAATPDPRGVPGDR